MIQAACCGVQWQHPACQDYPTCQANTSPDAGSMNECKQPTHSLRWQIAASCQAADTLQLSSQRLDLQLWWCCDAQLLPLNVLKQDVGGGAACSAQAVPRAVQQRHAWQGVLDGK